LLSDNAKRYCAKTTSFFLLRSGGKGEPPALSPILSDRRSGGRADRPGGDEGESRSISSPPHPDPLPWWGEGNHHLLRLIALIPILISPLLAMTNKINYQGVLKEAGIPVTGTRHVEFKIWNAPTGGQLLWSGGSQIVQVTEGVFSVFIGPDAGWPFDWAQTGLTPYLETVVENQTLQPRDMLASAPMALTAQTVSSLSSDKVKLSSTSVSLTSWQSTTDPTKIDGSKIQGGIPPGLHASTHRQGGTDPLQLTPSQIDGTVLVANPSSSQVVQPTSNVTALVIKGFPNSTVKVLSIYDSSDPASEQIFVDSSGNLILHKSASIDGNLFVSGQDVLIRLLPSGMIAMFDQSCPNGWTRFAALDGKFPQGAAAYGGAGGSATHSHTVNSHTHSITGTTSNASLTGSITTYNANFQVTDGQCEIGLGTDTSIFSPTSSSQHNHNVNLTSGSASPGTDSQSNVPPYLSVVWCKKN